MEHYRKREKSFLSFNFSFYNIVSYIGSFVRVGVLPIIIPSISETLTAQVMATLHCSYIGYQILLAFIMFVLESPVLNRLFYVLSFSTTGVFYEAGSCKAYGSILYTLFYTFYTAATTFLIAYFSIEAVLLVAVLFWAITSTIFFLSAKLRLLPEGLSSLSYGIICFGFLTVTVLAKVFSIMSTLAFVLAFVLTLIIAVLNIWQSFNKYKPRRRYKI